MSSWQSRSDTQEGITLRALDALLIESANVPHDPKRVYLTGMSGTAKTLWVVAPVLRGKVAGLIGSAGGRPPELPPLASDAPPFFGWTGTTDFNFQEMHALDEALAAIGTPHRLEVYDGPHGWPASPGFVEAIAWMDLQAMRAGSLPRDDAFLDARVATCDVDAKASEDPLDRWRVFDHCARDLEGLRDVAAFRKDADALDRSADVRRLRALEARLRDDEARYRKRFDAWRERFNARYAEGREQPPPSHAATMRELRIASLRKRASDADPRVAWSARRQLAWVHAGAASYQPPAFEARGDTARVEALRGLAGATAPP
jgi:dienelactone hydrolase